MSVIEKNKWFESNYGYHGNQDIHRGEVISVDDYFGVIFKVLNQHLGILPIIDIVKGYWYPKIMFNDDLMHDLTQVSDVYICIKKGLNHGDPPHLADPGDGHCYCGKNNEWCNQEALLLGFRSQEFKNALISRGNEFMESLRIGAGLKSDNNNNNNRGVDEYPFEDFF